MRVKPEYYRQQAKRCRDLSKQTIERDVRAKLQTVAMEYDRLAEEAERKENARGETRR